MKDLDLSNAFIVFYADMISCISFFFFFNDPATTEIYTLSLHDALPIYGAQPRGFALEPSHRFAKPGEFVLQLAAIRSEEHTSELQSHSDLVCRLLLEKKKKKKIQHNYLQIN